MTESEMVAAIDCLNGRIQAIEICTAQALMFAFLKYPESGWDEVAEALTVELAARKNRLTPEAHKWSEVEFSHLVGSARKSARRFIVMAREDATGKADPNYAGD